MVNLSFNGARVQAEGATPAVDARATAILNPDSDNVQIPARVIYSTEDSYGFLFECSREELVRKLMPFFRLGMKLEDLDVELDEAS